MWAEAEGVTEGTEHWEARAARAADMAGRPAGSMVEKAAAATMAVAEKGVPLGEAVAELAAAAQ